MASNNVKITSKEMVRPSSPTLHHHRQHKLSLLDQTAPQDYIPLIFFYKSYHNIEQQPQQQLLKKSLSNILTEFYPLAGRLSRENFTVDCNDMGALFVESKAEGSVLEAIKDPTIHELEKFLPIRSAAEAASGEENAIVLAIQINRFDCGGIAVSVQMHHQVGDANSMVSFMNAWAAASNEQTLIPPTFDMASLFPPKDHMLSIIDSEPPNPASTENLVSKRFVFNKEELENLKFQASQVVKDPTRVEAVSSFLAKHYFRDIAKGSSKKYVALIHAVNLRPRMDPPLPGHAFGNAVSGAVALLPIDDDDDDDGNKEDLVEALRTAIRKTDGDFVKEKLQGDEYSDSLREFGELCLKAEPCFFSSWIRFPVYEVDYGWGRPVWVATASFSDRRNTVILMSTSCGEGMEAWLNMHS